jgi:hypothetical protein
MSEFQDQIRELAFKKSAECAERREEILTAFIAKYGYEPDKIILNEQPSTGKFWVERKDQWISVKDRLPEDGSYILMSGGSQITMGWLNFSRKEFIQCISWTNLTESVTHWMPLPEPPEKG